VQTHLAGTLRSLGLAPEPPYGGGASKPEEGAVTDRGP
jgi:hypothetical protein